MLTLRRRGREREEGEEGGGRRREDNLTLTNVQGDTRHKTTSKSNIREERSERWASHSMAPAGHEVTAEEPSGQ
jgi:hypothetical protein